MGSKAPNNCIVIKQLKQQPPPSDIPAWNFAFIQPVSIKI